MKTRTDGSSPLAHLMMNCCGKINSGPYVRIAKLTLPSCSHSAFRATEADLDEARERQLHEDVG